MTTRVKKSRSSSVSVSRAMEVTSIHISRSFRYEKRLAMKLFVVTQASCCLKERLGRSRRTQAYALTLVLPLSYSLAMLALCTHFLTSFHKDHRYNCDAFLHRQNFF